jgi:hypothetical protein
MKKKRGEGDREGTHGRKEPITKFYKTSQEICLGK